MAKTPPNGAARARARKYRMLVEDDVFTSRAARRAQCPRQGHPHRPALLQRRALPRTHRIERFFNLVKHYRRIATRFEKHAANYLPMLKLAAIRIWLRANESMV
jgi:transposase